jgi:hypothetical protein
MGGRSAEWTQLAPHYTNLKKNLMAPRTGLEAVPERTPSTQSMPYAGYTHSGIYRTTVGEQSSRM